MVSFSWLHLTDLHLGMEEQIPLLPAIKDRFFEDLKPLHEKCGPLDFVVFTGDLTLRGSQEEFLKVDEFLDTLWEFLAKLGSKPVLLAVPGNHDLVRPQPDPNKPPPAEVLVLKSWTTYSGIQSMFWEDPNSPYRNTVSTAFANYLEWWERLDKKPQTQSGLLPGDFSAIIEKSGASLGIVGLNSTFLQLADGNYKEKLVVDARQFQGVCGGDGPVWVKKHNACLLLTHQPPDWLTQDSQQQLTAEIAGNNYFAAHLFGHMHEARYSSAALGGAPALRSCQGSSLFGLEYFGAEKKPDRRHGYCAGRIELEDTKGFLIQWPRRAERPGGQWNFAADTVEFKLADEHTREEFELLRPFKPGEQKEGAESPENFEIPRPFPQQWAVMVGVNDYQDKDTVNLHYCRQDVVDLARSFRESLGFQNVFEFHDQSPLKPERDGILRKLVEIRGKVKPEDLFVFYFSGHGVNEDGKDYLLPLGCPPRDVKTLGIRVQDLADSLKKLGCNNTAMFVDACRDVVPGAKGAGAGTVSVGEESKTVLKDAGIIAFFSCDPKDRSFEIDELEHGSFTFSLLQAIREGITETVAELTDYLKENVPRINKKFDKNTQQPYAVIPDPESERGKLEIFFNPHWRLEAAQKFDPLIDKFIGLYETENVFDQLSFLDRVKSKKQLDQVEKNRVALIESFCNRELSLEMFFRIWKGPKNVTKGPEMKKPDRIT
jgi:predicted MPP superfamily phosphohydrolase